jgi:DNA-binding transcriptional ArsR family regulator
MPKKTDHKQSEPTQPDSEEEWEFEGFSFPTTTPVPDQLFDELLFYLSPSEIKVLLYIIRRTFGFKKSSDNISLKQLCEGIITKDGRILDRGTGLSKATVARVLTSLEEKNVIKRTRRRSRRRGDQPTTYELNFIIPVSQNETGGVSLARQGVSHPRDTQQTVLQQTDNNVVVISKLEEFGITAERARDLASRFSPGYIEQKIEFLEWKLDPETKTRGKPIKDPAGWLIRAIQKDWQPPSTFQTKAQRREEAKEMAEAIEEQKQQQRESREESDRRRAQNLKALLDQYGTSEKETETWEKVLTELEFQMGEARYNLVRNSYLLSVEDNREAGEATIAIDNSHVPHWLGEEGQQAISRALAEILGCSRVHLHYEVL